MVDKADFVIETCERHWEAHKSDCSGFAKAVADDLGVALSGQANAIVQHLRGHWEKAANGVEAAARAAEGQFVIGGLEAEPNGHVVVVVRGELNRGKYPTAYWGRLHAVGEKAKTINWSWSPADRDRVEYWYQSFV